MATHLLDYHAVEGAVTACGRNFDLTNLPRGIVVSTGTSIVSCQRCISTERFRLVKARMPRALDAPIPKKLLPAGERGQ